MLLMLQWLEPAAGVVLVALVLLDVFLTVLYARINTGIISQRLADAMFVGCRAVARALGRRPGDTLLSYCGPIILVATVTAWALGLILGMALIIHPFLGSAITATSGQTPQDFLTALYVAGDTMTTVGTSDLAPRTGAFRLLYVFNSLIGVSLITLTMTYLLEIYSSLQARNVFALHVHQGTAERGDAAELVAGLGSGGDFRPSVTQLGDLAGEMARFKEAHHFHSVLVYFRFAETHYALPRLALVLLDAVTLIRTALDEQRYGWLQRSAAVDQIWRSSMLMLRVVGGSFLPPGSAAEPVALDEPSMHRWRQRYRQAAQRLREAGIATVQDDAGGAEAYAAQRRQWDGYITAFAQQMAYDVAEIDPAGSGVAAKR